MTPNFRFRPSLVSLEHRAVPALLAPLKSDSIVLAPEDGGIPNIKIINPATGEDIGEIEVYNRGFTGGVRTAKDDVTGDGVDDIVTGVGPGGGPHIKLYDGTTGGVIREFFAYAPYFSGGISVALGDINRDGFADIITGAGKGGGPHIQVFDGKSGDVLRTFFAYDLGFSGGVNVASGDVNHDGFDDIIVGTNSGGGPHVYVRSGKDDTTLTQFFAYDQNFSGGVNVGSGDIDGDGYDDIITGAGKSGGPHVRVVSGRSSDDLFSGFVDDSAFLGGVRVSASDTNHDGLDDLLVRTRHGNDVSLSVLNSSNQLNLGTFIRKVDDNPSADDLIEGSGQNRIGTSNGGSSSNPVVSQKVEGTITAVELLSRKVTIKRGSTLVIVSLSSTTKIERNDLETGLGAFKIGDFGQAKIGLDGLAFKIEAVGG